MGPKPARSRGGAQKVGQVRRHQATKRLDREKVEDILDNVDDAASPGPVASSAAAAARARKRAAIRDAIKAAKPDQEYLHDPYWSPTAYSAFKLYISVRFAAALWTTISDCDETYNYWEPAYHLLYGKGFQTWEYSPEYALRSYTYIMLHAVPAKIYDYFLKPVPLLLFFFVRCCLAFMCAAAEWFLYRSVRRKFGGNVARIMLFTSLCSAGMFIACSAFLPSSFSMYMTGIAFAAWLDGMNELAIFATALSAILSWPFAAVTGALIAFDILFLQRQISLFVKWCFISLIIILVPVVMFDSSMYGQLVIAPWNIIKYNILSNNRGPDLYGTEEWTFYPANLFLNFNILFVFVWAGFVFFAISKHLMINLKRKIIVHLTCILWFAIFTLQPHKEERFMFPIFMLIPLCGAFGIDALQKTVDVVFSEYFMTWVRAYPNLVNIRAWEKYRKYLSAVGIFGILFSCLLGLSRILALYYGYRAPFDVFFAFNKDSSTQKAVQSGFNYTICYGKEWHRFPSSFFVPSPSWEVRFIQSEFKGQLPNRYAPLDPDATKKIPAHMNDWNKEEPSRYIDIKDCDYLVDLIIPDKLTTLEPNYADNLKEWKLIVEEEYLNNEKSRSPYRSLYIPFLSEQYNHYDSYVILKRRGKRKSHQKPKKKHIQIGKEFDEDEDELF